MADLTYWDGSSWRTAMNGDVLTNISVATSAWQDSSTYSSAGYTKRAAITVNGITSTDYADVTLLPGDFASANYANVCQTVANMIYIYAKATPDATLTIPVIVITKGLN